MQSELSSLSNRVLLAGPYGCDLYQAALLQALAHELGAVLLTYEKSSLGLEHKAAGQLPAGSMEGADDGRVIDMIMMMASNVRWC